MMKTKKLQTSVLFGILATANLNAYATGEVNDVTVTMLGTGSFYNQLCSSSECVFIAVSTAPTGAPACAIHASGWHFVLDSSTAAGRQTYSALLAAHATGNPVNIEGEGECNNENGYEDLDYVILTRQ